MLVGSHVPARTVFEGMRERGADVVQLHLSAPRQWRAPLPRDDADELRASGIVACAHAPYLCNPASADAAVRDRTALVLQQTLDEAERVGARGVVVHAGHAAGGGTRQDAIDRWLDVAGSLESPVPLLVENMATGQVSAGRHLDEIVDLFAALRGADLAVPVGACLDTCHAFAGDAASADDPVGWVKTFAESAGGIALLHVNGSRAPAGAGRDLHDNLDQGCLPMDVVAAMVGAAVDCGCTEAIVETPGGPERQAADIALVRQFALGT